MVQVPLMRLQCGCNSYEWGKLGKSSAAAKYAAATGFEVQDDKPYAELWMGTHRSLPSKDLETGRTLLDLIQDNQSLMTPEVAKKYGNQLPFLFKILSITKALSIQAHPNKKLAEQLHAKDSKNYPDDNHKPEMTIALTPFSGLCGFRPLAEIAHFLNTIPALKELVGSAAADDFSQTVKGHETSNDASQMSKNKKALKSAFTALMTNGQDSSALKTASAHLLESAQNSPDSFADGGGPSPSPGKELAELVVTLNGQFPEDLGLFVLFFLNYIQLDVGEALYLQADDIHAYLSGDIVECMATSDNVVRAGFTPKFKDVSTLTSMLTYSYAPIEEQKMKPTDYPFVKLNAKAFGSDSTATLYDPPIPEFAVVRTELLAEGAKATFEHIDGPSIVICTAGKGTIAVGPKKENLKEGFVYFVGAKAELVIESESSESLVAYKAFCELNEDAPATNGKI